MANEKTNAMRILDKYKINYNSYTYGNGEAVSGDIVAKEIGKAPEKVFKTLVTEGKSKSNYVFVVPVLKELDLKKAAMAVGEKSIAMIKSKDLLPVTGYVHGGCSPIGMKKLFRTVVDSSAENLETIIFSAGKIGFQVEVSPNDLKKIVNFNYSDISASEE